MIVNGLHNELGINNISEKRESLYYGKLLFDYCDLI